VSSGGKKKKRQCHDEGKKEERKDIDFGLGVSFNARQCRSMKIKGISSSGANMFSQSKSELFLF
jgi:hypothetical protein